MVGQFGAERKKDLKEKKGDLLRVWDNEGTMVRQFGMMKGLG